MLYRVLCRLRFDCRACVVQRLPGRLVTTPQTVQSFIDQLALARAPVTAHLTLVTLDCRPFDITRIVGRRRGAVYSPAVLSPRDQLGRLTTFDSGRRTDFAFVLLADEDLRDRLDDEMQPVIHHSVADDQRIA